MQIFSSKNECCGCTACKQVCPKNAITMKPDSEGFLYPEIDSKLCIECGACKRVCAFQNGYEKNHSKKAYAIKHKDFNTRFTSRSGAVFVAVSDYILNHNGSVYGAAFDEDFSVCHIRATDKSGRDKFKGSKYVQSDMKDTFKAVKEDLKNGMYVMFSGTACQVAGLIRYLGKCDTSKLYTCDLACHGVPSPKIWMEYLKHCEQKFGGKVTKADFRDKTIGWNTHKEAIWIDGYKHILNGYTYLFYENDIERPSCYNCKYSSLDRPADFTLADFWGIDRVVKNFNDNKGVSLLLVNSEKGLQLLDEVSDNIVCVECDIESSIRSNPNLSHPTAKPDSREGFWDFYYKNGFEKTYKKYYNKIRIKKIKRRINLKWNSLKNKVIKHN
ncbi:MAG TPA: F420H(2):quinone oxidoreductase [Ruminococcus sp.]|nr:F420H(2):quinone oxidoreductase [Ruminococcus sp.]